MNPLVSICIPVYNVCPYLARCLSSVLRQHYDTLEVILVDDASTDGSLDELRRIAASFPEREIQILCNNVHRGSPFSRRRSIEAAKGEYLLCVDADDILLPHAVEHLLAKALETNADIVCGQIEDIPLIGPTTIWPAYQPTTASPLADAMSNRFGSLCGKIFRRALFSGQYTFAPDGMDYGEDRIVCLYLSHKAQKIVALPETVYRYIHQPQSVSSLRTERTFRGMMLYWQYAEQFLDAIGKREALQSTVDYLKVKDKAQLLLFAQDNTLRRRFADIYPAETKQYARQIKGGAGRMLFLTSRHLWPLVSCYSLYMTLRRKTALSFMRAQKNKYEF